MESQRLVGTLERVLREERVHRLGLSSDEQGRMLVLEAVVGQGVTPPAVDLFPPSVSMPAVWGGEVRDGVVRYGIDLIAGESVGGLFSRLTPEPKVRRGLLLAVVEALGALHEQNRAYGLCHPQFVLLGADGQWLFAEPLTAHVQLACCATVGACRLGLFQGQLDSWSVPPEWAKAGAMPTLTSDVFQLAAWIAHDSLGESPFGPGLTMEVANRMAAGNPVALLKSRNRFSSYWVDALHRGLHPDPSVRFQSAGELLEALRATPEGDQASEGGVTPVVSPYDRGFAGYSPEKSNWGVHPVPSSQTAEARLLVDQMQRLRMERAASRRSGTSSGSSWFWWAVAGGMVLVAGLGIWVLSPQGGNGRTHEGAVSAETGGRTHSVDPSQGNPLPSESITEALLIQSIPGRVSRQLELDGAPLSGDLAFEPPILPPYRVRVRGLSGKEALFEFASKNRLSRVVLGGASSAQQPASYTVLYDASGEPKALMPYDPLGYPLTVQILPEAAMLPQGGKK